MTDLITSFIGKECIIYTMDTQLDGIIKEVKDGWLSVESKENTSAVNLDYVSRIREFPKNKKGKKSSLVLD